jgi:16S rRNA (cytidine1402-2'-O)-methyltransferase
MVPKGILYLVPTGLGGEIAPLLPAATMDVLHGLEHFIVEKPKSARAFLKAVGYSRPLQAIAMQTLDEHTPHSAIAAMLRPLEDGLMCGLLSEAGCPAIADPGAALIREAHRAGVRVVPLVGPSALLLALMASGLNGQRFAFHGYLPVERTARVKKLAELERESERVEVAQMFIETPYRNEAVLDAVVASCQRDTLLCIATDLTLPTESIRTLPVSEWKNTRSSLDRRPSVFLLYREKRVAGNAR